MIRAPYLQNTEERCEKDVSEKYVYNHLFEITRGTEFFKNGEIHFPSEPLMRRFKGETYADGTYRTRFGPCVEHNGQILRNSNHNMRLAMRRLLGVRKGDVKADRDLRKSQILFFAKHKHIIEELCTLYAPHFNDYTTMLEEAENHHDDPHQ